MTAQTAKNRLLAEKLTSFANGIQKPSPIRSSILAALNSKERYQENQRHLAAVAIAITCEKMPMSHPVVRLIAEGKNDEALQILEGMDSIRERLEWQ